jgi:predicted DNA-binding protein with PD1-like motif
MARWKHLGPGDSWLLVLDKGDEIVQAVTEFARTAGIRSGSLTGIGAVESAELGHYSPVTRDYTWRTIPGPLEIVSLTGNLALKDGDMFLHAHIVLGTHDMQLLGGHLKAAVVSATCEMAVHAYAEGFSRSQDEETGLWLLDAP